MEFFDAVVRYEVALWSAVDTELARQGALGLGQLYALRALDRHDGNSRVQDLSDDIGITVGAASKLVDRLERDGLAVRSPNPANRRSSLIALTGAGERALSQGTAVVRAAMAEAVGSEDVAQATVLLQRLHARLQERGLGVAA